MYSLHLISLNAELFEFEINQWLSPMISFSDKVFADKVPRCEKEECGGLVKPGEQIYIYLIKAPIRQQKKIYWRTLEMHHLLKC